MRCSICEKLRLEWESATAAHLDIVRMREADMPGLPSAGPQIWDYVLEMAEIARTDALRALENHLASHPTFLGLVSVALLTLISQSVIWQQSEELLEAL